MDDLTAAVNTLMETIRDRQGWARTGSPRADTRNDGELAGLYIALDALTGNRHPDEAAGRLVFTRLSTP
ncbi:hypothetical protein ACIQVO_36135 [Streptomyces sp. NPDC101062]|uniref:hypothetical protein n=1 Tax=unclassified Streptomyces TaxID=2593676 RepID=UPI003821C9AC